MSGTRLSPAEEAQFLAATAAAHVGCYFVNRDAAELQQHATQLMTKLLMVHSDGKPLRAIDATRMLVVAMLRTSLASDEARRDRWRSVMMSLDGLVRHECRELESAGAGGLRPAEPLGEDGATP